MLSRRPFLAAFACLFAIASFATSARGDDRAAEIAHGQTIYAASCVSCHGDLGQGVKGAHEAALVGDLSINELVKVISETMPEDKPGSCVGDDAKAVSRYVFETFYGEAAQAKLVKPRAALARLTTNQYRQSLSDLFAHFMWTPTMKPERGLSANYFDNPGWKNDKKKLTRTDPNIDVDYGQEAPIEGVDKTKFAVYWSGALLAPVTGSYKITARGEGSFIVKFIDEEAKFFDNHVSSGEMAEHSASVDLVGGRLYPISLDLIKRERKTGNVDVSMKLLWTPPKRVEEPIPQRFLVPIDAPTTFAPQTPMPPDDRSAGYERGSTISREWHEATTRGALEFADAAVAKLWPRYLKEAQKKDSAKPQPEILKAFCRDLVTQAFRRPIDDATAQLFIEDAVNGAPDDDEAIRRVVLLTLKSPRFLYPAIDGEADPASRRATRLALTLWDSIPTAKLQQLASEGKLNDEQSVRDRANAMLDDPRAKAKVLAGLHEWLDLARWDELTKNSELYPGFDANLVADLRSSLDLFLEEVVWGETSDFRQLIQADWGFTSDRIAAFYGDPWKPTGDAVTGRFFRTHSDPNVRAGVITHPFLMSALAYGDTSSPIFRGVFLLRHVLGRTIRVPKEAFTPFSPDLHPGLTTRERVALQTGEATCQGCHAKINGVGFALEGFDAVGRVRTEERSKPIDASGIYIDRGGEEIRFANSADLVKYLATSDDVVQAFINRLFLHMVKHPIGAYGENRMEQLKTRFRESGYHIRGLLIEIAVIAAEGPVPMTEA